MPAKVAPSRRQGNAHLGQGPTPLPDGAISPKFQFRVDCSSTFGHRPTPGVTMQLHCIFASLSLGFMAVMILTERADHNAGRWIAKILASLSFVALGLSWGRSHHRSGLGPRGGFGSVHGRRRLPAPPRSDGWFTAGLASFLLGHLAFAVAFIIRGVSPIAVGIALVLADRRRPGGPCLAPRLDGRSR